MFGIVGKIIDLGGQLLGLPPEITGAAKVVAGVCTGDVVTAVGGGVDIVSSLAKDAQATHYTPPKHNSARGYAQQKSTLGKAQTSSSSTGTASVSSQHNASPPQNCAPPPPDPAKKEESAKLAQLAQHFRAYNETYDFLGFRDDVISKEDLERLLQDPNASQDAKSAARYFLSNPDKMAAIDGKGGSQLGDAKWTLSDIYARKGEVDRQLATPPPTPPSKPSKPAAPTTQAEPAKPCTPPVKTDPNSPLAGDIMDYLKTLEVLQANFGTFDTAVGQKDAALSLENLHAICNNPNADPKLKEAAKFLIDRPEYFNRLEMSADKGPFANLFGFNRKDGVASQHDVSAEISKVRADIQKYGVPKRSPSTAPPGVSTGGGKTTVTVSDTKFPSQGTGNTNVDVNVNVGGGKVTSGSRDISDIVNDPSLSLEQKIQLILMKIAEQEDDEILGVMDEMGKTGEELAEMRADTKADDRDGQRALAKKQQNVELLQQRLQKAMERRKQMYDLMSNMSSKFNEMAKTAIQNLARA